MSIAPNTRSQDSVEADRPPKSRRGDWTWELVTTFPQQGDWTEQEYLEREFDGLVEYSDGVLEFLPIPNWLHQLIVDYLYSQLKNFVQARSLGMTAFAPLRIRVGPRRYREPDLLFIRKEQFRGIDAPPDGADLVMEVVSDSKEDRERDLVTKRTEYAAAGIPEYWIVDPVTETISVLKLEHSNYVVHGEFSVGSTATSNILPGFEINVTNTFAAGKAPNN